MNQGESLKSLTEVAVNGFGQQIGKEMGNYGYTSQEGYEEEHHNPDVNWLRNGVWSMKYLKVTLVKIFTI